MGGLFEWCKTQLGNMPWNRGRPINPDTRKKYNRIVLDFARRVERKWKISKASQLEQKHYAWYINYLVSVRGYSYSYVNVHKSVLKRFFERSNIPITVRVKSKKKRKEVNHEGKA